LCGQRALGVADGGEIRHKAVALAIGQHGISCRYRFLAYSSAKMGPTLITSRPPKCSCASFALPCAMSAGIMVGGGGHFNSLGHWVTSFDRRCLSGERIKTDMIQAVARYSVRAACATSDTLLPRLAASSRTSAAYCGVVIIPSFTARGGVPWQQHPSARGTLPVRHYATDGARG
jgi:hypothetical protein